MKMWHTVNILWGKLRSTALETLICDVCGFPCLQKFGRVQGGYLKNGLRCSSLQLVAARSKDVEEKNAFVINFKFTLNLALNSLVMARIHEISSLPRNVAAINCKFINGESSRAKLLRKNKRIMIFFLDFLREFLEMNMIYYSRIFE